TCHREARILVRGQWARTPPASDGTGSLTPTRRVGIACPSGRLGARATVPAHPRYGQTSPAAEQEAHHPTAEYVGPSLTAEVRQHVLVVAAPAGDATPAGAVESEAGLLRGDV